MARIAGAPDVSGVSCRICATAFAVISPDVVRADPNDGEFVETIIIFIATSSCARGRDCPDRGDDHTRFVDADLSGLRVFVRLVERMGRVKEILPVTPRMVSDGRFAQKVPQCPCGRMAYLKNDRIGSLTITSRDCYHRSDVRGRTFVVGPLSNCRWMRSPCECRPRVDLHRRQGVARDLREVLPRPGRSPLLPVVAAEEPTT